jgi:cyanophycin synthetase
MLNDGIKKTNSTIKITIIPSEKEAITHAVNNAKKDSLIILCSDVVPDALALVQKFKAQEDSGEKIFAEQ